jgi:hypothetical protein
MSLTELKPNCLERGIMNRILTFISSLWGFEFYVDYKDSKAHAIQKRTNESLLDQTIPASSGILLSCRSWNTMSNSERTILITGFTQGLAAEYAYDIKVINVISYINRYYKTTGKRWQTVDRIIEMYLKQFEKVEPDYNVA